MTFRITPGMTHGGSQFTPQQWGQALTYLATSDDKEMVATRAYIGLLYGGPVLGRAFAATKGVRTGMSWIRNPVMMYVANFGRTNLQRSLARGALGISKGIRYANYAGWIASPFMTYHYAKRGEYDKAILTWYGPPGTVWVYNRVTKKFEKKPPRKGYAQTGMPTNQPRVVKSKKMSEAQKMRLWRMGLRWCKTHQRYDRCSLRARR